MGSPRHRTQDLFEPRPQAAALTPDLQARLRMLVQTLLAEAAEVDGGRLDAQETQEARDDEDHR